MLKKNNRMEKEKIKVVWLCHFSNSFVHEKLELCYNPMLKVIRKLAHKSVRLDVPEFANWITNGIRELEKIDEVELHVVSPYPLLRETLQEFEANGVYYHFFHNEEDDLIPFLFMHIFHPANYRFKRNRGTIEKIINSIQPEIMHLFGAENPYYSLGMFGNYGKVVTIAQLQTLMSDPLFKENYPIDSKSYEYRSRVERNIIKKADYIGTPVLKYRQIINRDIKPHAIFLNTGLVLKDPIVDKECEKLYDFVYFAANINKAADLAIEAFAIVHRIKPQIKMDIIGGYDNEYKKYLNSLIEKYRIVDAVTFEGKLPTHDDVLKKIRNSRFALLPLKVDITSGTIREAMSNGLPVITTDTGELGTQELNLKRQNVMISPIGDYNAMADNMLRLLEDKVLVETLRQNSYQTRLEARSNEETVKKYVEVYKACLNNYWNKTPLPKEVTEV